MKEILAHQQKPSSQPHCASAERRLAVNLLPERDTPRRRASKRLQVRTQPAPASHLWGCKSQGDSAVRFGFIGGNYAPWIDEDELMLQNRSRHLGGPQQENVVDLTSLPDDEVVLVGSSSAGKKRRKTPAVLVPDSPQSQGRRTSKCGICFHDMGMGDRNMACGPCGAFLLYPVCASMQPEWTSASKERSTRLNDDDLKDVSVWN